MARLDKQNQDFDTSEVVNFVREVRERSLSDREWKHYLAGYGYSVKNDDAGKTFVASLVKGDAICELPSDLCA